MSRSRMKHGATKPLLKAVDSSIWPECDVSTEPTPIAFTISTSNPCTNLQFLRFFSHLMYFIKS